LLADEEMRRSAHSETPEKLLLSLTGGRRRMGIRERSTNEASGGQYEYRSSIKAVQVLKMGAVKPCVQRGRKTATIEKGNERLRPRASGRRTKRAPLGLAKQKRVRSCEVIESMGKKKREKGLWGVS